MNGTIALPSTAPPLAIGLTFDLRASYLAMGYGEEETAELDQPGTIAALEETLRQLGHRPERIGHVGELAARLLAGARWDLVLNIAEGMHGLGREALVPALLDHYRIPYTFSDPAVMAVTLHKAMAKRLVRDAGIPTAPFAVVEPGERCDVDLPLPLFVKPVAEGTGKGVSPASIIRRREELAPRCRELLERYRQPVLVESWLPGRELTVGILGSGRDAEVVGTLEVRLRPGAERLVYSFVNKERCEELVDYLLAPAEEEQVQQAEALALAAWRTLGCRDAGRVDLRCDAAGEPQFLEVNPLAGLHPHHSDLPILCTQVGMPYRELLRRIVDSAWRRHLVEATPAATALSLAGAAVAPAPGGDGARPRPS